jgi:hypothetical protein
MTRVDSERYALRPSDREGTPAVRTYRTLVVSGALAPLALAAATIAHGDWQPALAAFAGLTIGAFVLSLTRLLAIVERPGRPGRPAPGAPRRRTLARPAPAAEPRREAAPSAAHPELSSGSARLGVARLEQRDVRPLRI